MTHFHKRKKLEAGDLFKIKESMFFGNYRVELGGKTYRKKKLNTVGLGVSMTTQMSMNM